MSRANSIGRRAAVKAALAALAMTLAAGQAHAISRYSATSMSCSAIQSAVQREGAVVLRWIQPPDIQRYNRLVADDRFCDTFETAYPTVVPSADLAGCGVYECRRYDPDDFFFFPWPKPRLR